MAPDISIVIPVYNGAAYLAACLKSIQELRPAPIECIVVNDGSTDASARIAQAAGVTVVSTSGRCGPGCARNLGAGIARGEILLFVDGDVVVPPDALARIAARFSEDPARDAVIGSYDQDPASPDLLSQYRNLLHCYTHQRGQLAPAGSGRAAAPFARPSFGRTAASTSRITGRASKIWNWVRASARPGGRSGSTKGCRSNTSSGFVFGL